MSRWLAIDLLNNTEVITPSTKNSGVALLFRVARDLISDVPFTSIFIMFSWKVLRGHHVYTDMWVSFTGEEELIFQHEVGNLRDPSVLKGATIVGHVHCRISVICSMFLQLGSNINFTMTESNLNEVLRLMFS